MMSVGGLGLARGGTGANSRVRAPMAGPSSPSAELQRRAGPSAAVKLSWAESVLLWAVMEMRGGAWLPGGMGGGAFLKLKAAARDAETQRVSKASVRLASVSRHPTHPRGAQGPTCCHAQSQGLFPPSSTPEGKRPAQGHNAQLGASEGYSQEPGLPETEAGAARRGRQSSS